MTAPLPSTTSRVSAVICTRNRPDMIPRAVASVLASAHDDFDLTVIDQSTTSATREAIEPMLEADARLRYFHMDEAGLSRAYNAAIRRTTGPLLAFTDDDCVVPQDWLSRIEAAFDAEPEGDLLYGEVTPLVRQGDDVELIPSLRISHPQKLSRQDGFKVFGMGANFAARRRLFDSIGGFDEILGGGGPLRSSQDFDLAYRTYRGGHVILLRPEVTLFHDGRREREDWPALLTNYGFGDGAFYSKHVRCRDPYALWLLTSRIASTAGRDMAKRILGRRPGKDFYLRGVFGGIRAGRKFDVDRPSRLYVER